jgi:hypothetical protein
MFRAESRSFTKNRTGSRPYWLEEGYNVQGLNAEALVCRVQLLEEGQTKDLTILVGHRLEEGASSQEVMQLR